VAVVVKLIHLPLLVALVVVETEKHHFLEQLERADKDMPVGLVYLLVVVVAVVLVAQDKMLLVHR
jgi:hypothetical protein